MPDSFNDDDHHDHDRPDFANIEIPYTARVASSHESTSIVIMHDSNTATSIRASGCVCREPMVDLTAMMWVSHSAYATHFPSFPPSAPVYGPMLRKCLHLEDSLYPFFIIFRHRISVCVLPSRRRPISDLPACTSNTCATRLRRRASTSTQLTSHPRPHDPSCLNFSAIYIAYPERVGVFESCVTWSSRFRFSWVLELLHVSCAGFFRYSVSGFAMRSSTSSSLAFP